MPDDDLPGFIDEGPVKPPPAPAPAAAKPAFDPFADVEAAPPPPTPAAVAAPAPRSGSEARAQAEVEADIKPGAGKDLWACPHCGAKNKPERNSCRSCGKSPSEPVVVPLHRQPWFMPAVAGAVVLVLVLVWLVGSGAPGWQAAGPAWLDRDLRSGGTHGDHVSQAELEFRVAQGLAGSGRVLRLARSGASPVRTVSVILVFARSPERLAAVWDQLSAVDDERLELTLEGRRIMPGEEGLSYALIHFVDPERVVDDVQSGDWLSFQGDEGRSEAIPWSNGALRANEYVVWPRRAERQRP